MRRFTVLGEPIGKGRPKFSTFNGHATAYTPAKTVNFENLVRISYQEKLGGLPPYDKDEQLIAEIYAYFTIPKSTSKKRRELMLKGFIKPTKKPDCDNVAKAVLDALNGIAYHDDSQIVYLGMKKFYSDQPRTEVMLYTDYE